MPYRQPTRVLVLAVACIASFAAEPVRGGAVAQEPHEQAGGSVVGALSADTLSLPRLGWRMLASPTLDAVSIAAPVSFTPAMPPADGWADRWTTRLTRVVRAHRDSLWLAARDPSRPEPSRSGREATGLTAVRVADVATPAPEEAESDSSAGALSEYADLGIRIRGRSDFGGSWDRHEPCTAAAAPQCDPPLFPRIAPETQLSVIAEGTVLDRVNVAVDYDAAREFDASNHIRITYEGESGEFLRRLEVGDVSLRLPASRFLTQNVPAGNWGVRASARAGPLELQALWARQGGQVLTREFRHDGGGSGFAQETEIALDDADFAGGQFFFLFDPALIDGSPHVDVLGLTGNEAPPALVAQGIQLYRYTGGPPAQDGSTVILRAVPSEPELEDAAVTGPFRLLEAGVDYQLHHSGIWLALKNPLREDEALAVAYVSVSGDTIGDLDVIANGGAPAEVRLLRGTRAATWPLEMRQVYRVSGSNAVDVRSMRLVVSRGEASGGDLGRVHPATGESLSYLQLFGLDDDPPLDEPDAAHLYVPAETGADPVLDGVFAVFPTLRPFAVPPPLPGAGLTADETAALLGDDANSGIYEATDERERHAAARFRLNFRYSSGGQGPPSTLALGAVGIREGSERITVDGRLLQRGVDYEILYDVGQVEFRNPASLFAGRPDADIRATFEQKPMFAVAATEVFGVTARYPLGAVGELNFVGLSQQESALVRRPTLGLEPAAMLLGGVSGRLEIEADWLDRMLAMLPARQQAGDPAAGHSAGTAGSRIMVSGELAMSLPDPNRRGSAYLDDFQDADAIGIPLARQEWRLGSAPASRQGAEDVLPASLDALSAGDLVWQHAYRDGRGEAEGHLRAEEIDQRIRIAGTDLATTALYVTLNSDGAGRTWRSITNVLSAAGRDLRTQEYIELYLRGGESTALVLDLGTVSEDAFALDAEGRTGGTDASGETWGLGVLDREWDPAREVWTGETGDQRGLWNAECLAEPGASYPLADPLANCTRNNGLADTEDLNGNGILDTEERVLRWVIEPGDAASPYLVRDTAETGTGFRLYRIPLDMGSAVGASAAELRSVRHLRLTVVGSEPTTMTLARMRLVGAGWEKREGGGVIGGLLDAERLPQPGGRLDVGYVSTLSEGEAYVSPPGIVRGAQDPAATLAGAGGGEFNERSLRLRYQGIAPGDRVEVFRSYTGQPRNFLVYRQIRLWALAKEGEWGRPDGEQLVVRVGSGPGNFYLYRTPLREAGSPSGPGDWEPEVAIDFSRWLRLRAEAERLLLDRPETETEPLVVWDADSTYAVVIGERGRAPNLAAVREISISVWNGGGTAADGEVWIDDIRLSGANRQPGTAGELNLSVRGGDVIRADVSYTGRGGHFRQLDGDPTYQDDAALDLRTSLQLGALLPADWGIDAPIRVHHRRASADPIYLEGSDLAVASLGEVRRPAGRQTEVRFEIGRRRDTSADDAWSLLDGLRLGLAYRTNNQSSAYSTARHSERSAFVEYRMYPASRTIPVLPGLAGWGWLPPSLRGGLADLRLRWTPVSVSVRTEWVDRRGDQYQYESLLLGADPGAQARESAIRQLVQETSVGVQPFPSITGGLTFRSARDLLPSSRLNPLAAGLLDAERTDILGLDLGREARRSVSTRLAWNPRLASWLTARTSVNGSFAIDHDPSYLGVRIEEGDTARTLLRSFGNGRAVAARVTLDPGELGTALGFGTSPDSASAGSGSAVARLFHMLGLIELDWGRTLDSRYDRTSRLPGFGYQLGLGARTDLLAIGGDSATLVGANTDWSARTQLRLSGALTLDIGYGRRQGTRVGQRARFSTEETDWPDLRIEWRDVPVPATLKAVLSELTLSSGYRRNAGRREDRISSVAREVLTNEVPVGISVRWNEGPTTSYRAEWHREVRTSPHSVTRQAGVDHAFIVRHTFLAPGTLSTLFPEPLSLSFRYVHEDRRECRLADPLALCSARNEFVNYGDRTLGLQLDTRASGMNLGVQLDYHDRQSRIGEHIGNSTLTLGIFGQFDVTAGRLGEER